MSGPVRATLHGISADEFNSYESGEMSEEEVIDLFQRLVDSGLVWELQGSYGRTATALIEAEQVHLNWRGTIDR